MTTGTQMGPYRIVGPLGSGAMGEVYRAHDTKLGREVAIKVLPSALAQDADRRVRFEREARMLAALHHPHIATIFGVEESTGVMALVMELVEGPTLAECLEHGPLPRKQAIAIARQLADALDAAHEKGIVHRDLKPTNIKVMTDGTVKVLDFGLATAVSGGLVAETDATRLQLSQDGAIRGTPAYMSPEQARGQTVDKRTDIWAFGCVVYEMLAGRAPFTGATTSDIIASVLQKEPDLAALPASTPPAVRNIITRCLDKDPRRRLRDIGDAWLELDAATAARQGASAGAGGARSQAVAWGLAGAAALIAVAALGTSVWMLSRRGDRAMPVARATVTLPASQQLDAIQTSAPLVLSPDGRRIAYVAATGGRAPLYVRSIDAFDARLIDDTDGARYPFFSPDGQSIAFFAGGKLKRVSVAGGAPVVICDVARVGRGGTWGPDGTIVFDSGTSLLQVKASGGEPAALTSRNAGVDGQPHEWPTFFPDGRGLLADVTGTSSSTSIAVMLLKTREWHVLAPGSQAQYLRSGYLVYHVPQEREGQINAVPFDLDALAFQGKPVPVLDNVFRTAGGGAALYSIAQDGTMIFAPGGFARGLVHVDRQGRRTPLVQERVGFRFPRFSPDGRKVAVAVDPRPSHIWVYDIDRGTRVVLTEGRSTITPVWTADGQRVAYSETREIDWRVADAARPPEKLLGPSHADVSSMLPNSFSADGRVLIYGQQTRATDYDIWMVRQGEQPRMLLGTAARELAPRLSPDGRWLAYYSTESGRHEVYVRPFPNVDEHRWLVSTGGGWTPVWSPRGGELFYMNGTSMLAVPVETKGAVFASGKPEVLFDGPFDTTQDMNFDVAPDGAHFVMVEADPDAKPTKINIVFNWTQDLERLVPR